MRKSSKYTDIAEWLKATVSKTGNESSSWVRILLSVPNNKIMKNENLNKQFLHETESSGRHIVTSFRTGKKYYIEPIGNPHINWGDVNPATKKLEGDYGDKYRGSIDENESLITKENGFEKIHYTGIGGSPYSLISELDEKYPTIERS